MTPDLLKDVRDCVNRHRGRDYAESIRDQRRRQRRKLIVEAIKNTLAGLAVIVAFYGALEVQRVAESAVARQEQESERERELIAWHTVSVDACLRPGAER